MFTRRVTLFIILLLVIAMILASISALPFFVSKSNKWAIASIQIDKLKELGLDGSDVTIGIVDSGADISHQEFDKKSFIAWKDFISNKKNYYDDDDQGTHIAGILVSKGSFEALFTGLNLEGIAIDSKLIIAKTVPKNQYLSGLTNDSLIAKGILFCIENNADIILLSLSNCIKEIDFSSFTDTKSMINLAISKGIFVIAPSGNDGQEDDGDVCLPSSIDSVISVGSISSVKSISIFSSRGHQYIERINPNKKPELVAPGEEILSTRRNGGYGKISGTSQAAAYVAGAIALMLEAYPQYKHDGIKNENETTINLFKDVFAKTSKKIGSLQGQNQYSHDDYYGYGLIQAYDAYKELAKY